MPLELDSASLRGKSRILVVEDSATDLQLCVGILRREYEVAGASSSEEAHRVASAFKPDLILLDVRMPEMDGYETLSMLRESLGLGQIPVVFMTASEDPRDHVRALKMGAQDFIVKPLNATLLRHRISAVIERNRLQLEAMQRARELEQLLTQKTELAGMLESAFQCVTEALIITDADLRVLECNRNASTMFGAAVANHDASLEHWQFGDRQGREIAFGPLRGETGPQECSLVLPDGSSHQVEFLARRITPGDAQSQLFFSIQDVAVRVKLELGRKSALHRAQVALAELTKQKRALDEHCLVTVADAQGAIVYVNRRVCEITGYRQEELVGRTHRMFQSDVHPPSFYRDMWHTMQSGQIWRGEMACTARSGERFWVESTIVPWLDDRGVPHQYAVISTEISERVSIKEELGRMHAQEMVTAAQIQKRLLFNEPPAGLTGFAFAVSSQPSQIVDGDFHMFTRLGPHSFELLAGDVMGKGISAAMIGAGMTTVYRRILAEWRGDGNQDIPGPGQIVNRLHAEISPELMEMEAFITLSVVRFDREAMTVSWASAGHTPGLMVSPKEADVIRLESDNLPLGVLDTEFYTEQSRALTPGDVVLMFSDGVADAANGDGQRYGMRQVCSVLERVGRCGGTPQMVLKMLLADLREFTAGCEQADDRTIVVIGVENEPDGCLHMGHVAFRTEYAEIPRQLDMLGLLRDRISSFTRDQPEEYQRSLVLAAFEAATNIIRHVPEVPEDDTLSVALSRDTDSASVELTYIGQPFVQSELAEPDFTGATEGGFGLFIMNNMVDRVLYKAPANGLASVQLVKNFHGPI